MTEPTPGRMAPSQEEEAQAATQPDFLDPEAMSQEKADARQALFEGTQYSHEEGGETVANAVWAYAHGQSSESALQAVIGAGDQYVAETYTGMSQADLTQDGIMLPSVAAREFLLTTGAPVPAFLQPQQ